MQPPRARKTPGTYTGNPGTGTPVCGPSRASTRRIAGRDEFPTTITAGRLGGPPEPSAEAEFGARKCDAGIAGSLGGGGARPCPSGLATGTPQTFPVARRLAMRTTRTRKFPPRHYRRDAPRPAHIPQLRAGGVW